MGCRLSQSHSDLRLAGEKVRIGVLGRERRRAVVVRWKVVWSSSFSVQFSVGFVSCMLSVSDLSRAIQHRRRRRRRRRWRRGSKESRLTREREGRGAGAGAGNVKKSSSSHPPGRIHTCKIKNTPRHSRMFFSLPLLPRVVCVVCGVWCVRDAMGVREIHVGATSQGALEMRCAW